MWKPPIDFLTLHYIYITCSSLLGFFVIYAFGNLGAIDAFFFGASGSTESGLNTVDVKDLKLYQQIVIYVIPVITNLAFINIVVVVVRLHWFEKRFKQIAKSALKNESISRGTMIANDNVEATAASLSAEELSSRMHSHELKRTTTIRFAEESSKGALATETALYVPPPHLRDRGHPLIEVSRESEAVAAKGNDAIEPGLSKNLLLKRSRSRSLERVASSAFAIGSKPRTQPRRSASRERAATKWMPKLSLQATVGRNSQFHNLSVEDRELLGGVEYRALKLLLKVILVYFFGLHILGVICLLPWIHNAPTKYIDYLAEMGQGRTWWAFYSAQTMVDNLGFTLTPDSMIYFRDATWPMLIMTFLAFAGNTCYPIFLRLTVWMMSKALPTGSKLHEPAHFLLDHPRRCYTLLFPSKPTWILFGILVVLNTIDVILIIALDLDNSEVTDGLTLGPRILAALFQAASSRHTGTSTFNLADVNPAVQVSLLVMMYIAIFPIAMSIRTSNTYEERSLGIYSDAGELNEQSTQSYLVTHMQNQLSFDLWYIFLGIFCICIAESSRIMDGTDPAFSIFPIFFEVVSAYGNVGLSLGHPDVATSLSGQFSTFSKVVICAMMIRGRHRMLPYRLDRAIMLPSECIAGENDESAATKVDSDARSSRNQALVIPPEKGLHSDKKPLKSCETGLKRSATN